MMTEGDEWRWLLHQAFIIAKGARVYATTIRIERGVVESWSWGRTDATRYQVEVDCVAGRHRLTSGANLLAGRDVHEIVLTPDDTGWRPGSATALSRLVCRIAQERGL
jgi:hypothetical protein